MLQICFVIFNPYNPTRHSLLHGTLCWVLFSRCEQSQSSEAQAASTDWTSRHDTLRGRIQLLLLRLLHLAVATALSNRLSTPCEITITTCCCGSCHCTNFSELCLGKLVGHVILQKELTKDTAWKFFDDGHVFGRVQFVKSAHGWNGPVSYFFWVLESKHAEGKTKTISSNFQATFHFFTKGKKSKGRSNKKTTCQSKHIYNSKTHQSSKLSKS